MSYDDFDDVLDSLDRSIEEINRQYNIPDYDACVDCRYFENIHYDIFGSKTRNYCTKKKRQVKASNDACHMFVK